MSEPIPKEQWPAGPWHDEPDVVPAWKDAETGYPCMIHRGPMGALCGYVAVNPGHPLHGRETTDDAMFAIQVHGGATYASACAGEICHVPEPGEPDDVWWFGFDCAHCDDVTPVLHALCPRLSTMGEYRTIDYVKGEIARMAASLKAIADLNRTVRDVAQSRHLSDVTGRG